MSDGVFINTDDGYWSFWMFVVRARGSKSWVSIPKYVFNYYIYHTLVQSDESTLKNLKSHFSPLELELMRID